MKRRNDDNGFEAWGGYMNAKISKLEEQFQEDSACNSKRLSNIFSGVAIFVNGYTNPPAESLRRIMLEHGGTFHDYEVSTTTHIIASNLPNAKLQKKVQIIKPEWITECVKAGKLLPITPFLLRQVSSLQSLLTTSNNDKTAKTAKDASFLDDFYNKSRLHHLSTMGALLKQYVTDLRNVQSRTYPGLERLHRMESDNSMVLPKNTPVIMHIDMDCFFVSVARRNRPELEGKPVAITHARGNPQSKRPGANPEAERELWTARRGLSEKRFTDKAGPASETIESMSEVASVSYEARKCGVRNGMYLGRALSLCPNLLTVPYDFEAYQEASYALYDTVAEYTLSVEAVSCDELYVDCTAILTETGVSPATFAKCLRADVTARTQCPCSAGMGSTKLLARLASKMAKPNGQVYIHPNDVEELMRGIPLSDLPGVGWSTLQKLEKMGVETCGDLQELPIGRLKSILGAKNGETLYRFCRGIDQRSLNLEHKRKSVSAEVNYGIRFESRELVQEFLERLSKEVTNRLNAIGMVGKNVTLKFLVRSPDAPKETAKFLGHGVCDAVSKSLPLTHSTSELSAITSAVLQLYSQMDIPPDELRGVGIHIAKLEDPKKRGALASFLSGAKPSNKSKLKPIKKVITPEIENQPVTVSEAIEIPEDNDLEELSCREVRTLFSLWVTSEVLPRLGDVLIAAAYIKSLALSHRLEDLEITIKNLWRQVNTNRSGDLPWVTVYKYIVTVADLCVWRKYGSLIKLPNF